MSERCDNSPSAGGASVRLKLVLLLVTIALFAGAVPAAVNIERSHRAAQARLDSQLEQVATLVATGGVFADGGGGIDGRSIRNFVQNAAAMELPVAYVLVENSAGEIDPQLSAVNVAVLREVSTSLAAAWERERSVDVLEALRDGAALGSAHRSLAMQLEDRSGSVFGTLSVGMSALDANKRTRAALMFSAAIVGAFLVLSLTLAVLAAGRMVRPLQQLAVAMTLVAEGDLEQDLEPRSNDEVGRLTVAFNEMTAGLRQRERLRTTLGRYVSSEVAERILTETDDLDLRGEVRVVSVFFLDMRNFTSLAEKLAPQEIVELLNAYFEIIVAAVLRYDGVINKFIGDAIMAVWGAPRACPNHAWQAVRAAWSIQRAVGTFNWERMKGRQEVIHIGIGVNTGEAIAGNVGTAQRLEYTVIGDEVNLAQRLEAMALPGQVLVSSSTYEMIRDRVTANVMDAVKVKGRESLVTPYEIIDVLEDEDQEPSAREMG